MKTLELFGPRSIWSMLVVFVVIFLVFLLSPHQAQAADASEYVWFIIDTELDVRNAVDDNNVVTVRWSCGSGLTGLITDKTSSESGGAVRDGIIKVASASKEMTDAGCSFKNGATIRASASLDGWITRTKEFTMLPSTSYTSYFGALASMDYNFVVGLVKDELGSTLTLNGTTASASYSGTTASASYSSGYKYIAATGDGTLTGGADGYVNKTLAITWSSAYGTTSKSADFDGTALNSTYNGDALLFGLKATLNVTSRSGVTESKVGATVTAGDSLNVPCTDNSDGKYYCAIPLAHTGASVQGVASGYNTNTATYADRIAGSDDQSLVTFALAESAAGGGTAPTPTPTPTPTPEPGISSTPEVTPTPTPAVTTGAVKLFRKVSDPKVYVQGSDGTLSWVRTIEAFNTAGYRWADVQVISGSEFAQMRISEGAAPVTAMLFRKANDPKVYVQGSDGTLTWVKTIEAFNAAGYSWADVKVISGTEFAQMRVGGDVRVVKGIAFLRVRAGPSTAYKMVGKVLPGQELKFTEMKNGWYKIDSGWVSGAYAKEF